jgi:hypothetical protein
MKQLVFASEAFNEEFENLVDHCSMVYDELQKAGLILKKLILMSLVKSLSRKLKMNLKKIIANR